MKFKLEKNINAELSGYLGSISENGREMQFLVRPAKNPSTARALVVLHGHGSNKQFAKYKSDNWTVIVPLDTFGTNGFGSWWLGENGDFFTYRLLQELIKRLREVYSFPSLYFWGSSMGGYGAIAHGLACRAHAIYAHIPQTKLRGTVYTDGINKVFYAPIFGDKEIPVFADLTKVLATTSKTRSPVMFLSQNTFDYPNYVKEHFLPFVSQCDALGFAYTVTMPLVQGHERHMNIAQTIEKCFSAEYENIKSWRTSGSLVSKD